MSDQTIQAKNLGDFFKHLAKAAKNVGKKKLNISGRALECTAKIGNAAARKNSNLFAATASDVINFVHRGKCLYFCEIQ